MWPTNLMGRARIELQLEPDEHLTDDDIAMRQFGYTVIYLALVIYTMLFLFRYLKRLLMLTFLTIIAPLVAMTYPLDKIKDGSAQAFNMWFKEYLFNLLIQPVHLILYTVLIGSAMDLVVDNLIFGLVALGFILQAEKLLRKFFGFDKASTIAGGSALGGALAMQGINQLRKIGAGKGGSKATPPAMKDRKTRYKERDEDKDKDLNSLINSRYGEQSDDTLPGNTSEGMLPPRDKPTPPSGLVDQYGNSLSSNTQQPKEEKLPEPDNTPQPLDDRGILKYGKDWIAGKADDRFNLTQKREAKAERTAQKQQIKHDQAERKRLAREEFLRKHPVLNAARNTGGSIFKGAKTVGKGIAYTAPKAARIATKAALKGTLAGAGLVAGATAGLVSDDFSNVVKWGATGAGAGFVGGKGLDTVPGTIEKAGNSIGEGIDDIYTATHTKDEVDARNNDTADKLAIKDPERVKYYQDKLKVTAREAKKIVKEDAQEYRKMGITDDKIITKAMKADNEKFGSERTSEDRILLAKMATEVGKDKKELKHVEEGLTKRNVPKAEVDKYITAIRDMNDWT